MVGSVFGVMFGGYNSGGGEQSLTYGEYTFRSTGNSFVTQINGKNVAFSYHPRQVEHLNISEDVQSTLSASKALLLTSNYSSPTRESIATAQFLLKETVGKATSSYVAMGFLQDTEYKNPKITCNNATSYAPVVVYQLANETAVQSEGNCITVKATGGRHFSMMSNRLAYLILGVM